MNNAQHITWYIKNWSDNSIFKVKTFDRRFHDPIGLWPLNAQLFIHRYRYTK